MDGESGEYASQLARWCRDALEQGGHSDCSYLDRARYIPESAAVVCGCGQFTDAPVVGDDPSEPSSTAVAARGGTLDRVAQDPIQSALALIDASEIYTPDQVERHILDVLSRLETGALFERETVERLAEAQYQWERMYWRKFESSQASSDKKREAEARVACDDAELTAELHQAKMLNTAVKATMHNLRAVLTGYQSVAHSVRATYQAGGSAGRF